MALAIGVSAGVLVLAVILAVVIVVIRRRYKHKDHVVLDRESSVYQSTHNTINLEMKTSRESTSIITDVEIKQKIGGGNFGDVYKGLWKGSIDVALKKTKNDSLQFEKEAAVLRFQCSSVY